MIPEPKSQYDPYEPMPTLTVVPSKEATQVVDEELPAIEEKSKPRS